MDQETMLKTIVIGYMESRLGTHVAKQVSDVVLDEQDASDQNPSAMESSRKLLNEIRANLDADGETVAVIDDMLGYLEPSSAPAP